MPAFSSSAPGKIILFGEHAVVYGHPAIAVPVTQVKAKAIVTPNPLGEPGSVQVQAPDIALDSPLAALPLDDAILNTLSAVFEAIGVSTPPAFKLRVTSTIPLAAGLGSGAAVSVAITRAVSGFLGHPLEDEQVSALVYEIEKIHHGTPSGIDNTVITYAMPVYYIKDQEIQTFTVPRAFTIVIGDTGIPSPTSLAVGDVRKAWQANPSRLGPLFEAAGRISQSAKQAIAAGNSGLLGPLMDQNHDLLAQMGVSSPELDQLVAAARQGGALGAKLSGGGRGGNMIALADAENANAIAQALQKAGAANTIITQVSG
ncbi:MAG: mevalonate kinase [Anaerolineae bacterium]|nr:mevalonate kinase [Anaerolineae bacterium]